MRYAINLLNEPNQKVSANLQDNNGNYYAVDLSFRTYANGSMSADIIIDDQPARYGVLVNDRMPLVPNHSLNGNIYFEDQYGNENPSYEQFNERFLLIYDTECYVG